MVVDLSKFRIKFASKTAIKGQPLVDFMVDISRNRLIKRSSTKTTMG